MLLEFWSRVLHYLYFPDDLFVYLDVCVRALFSLYYLPIWGAVFAILHSALESIVYTLIVPAALEVQRGVQISGQGQQQPQEVGGGCSLFGGNCTIAGSIATAPQTARLLLGSQVLESLVPSFFTPFLGLFATIDLPGPIRVALESLVVLATLVPHGALAVASCVIGHKLLTVIVEAMVDAFSRLEDGKDYPLVAARLRYVCKNPRRFTVFTVVCGLIYFASFALITTAAVVEYADRPLDVVLVSGFIISAAVVFMVGTAVRNAPRGLRLFYFKTERSAAAKANSKGQGAKVSPKAKGKGKRSTPDIVPASADGESPQLVPVTAADVGPSADDISLALSEYDDTDGYYREGRKRYHFMMANAQNSNNKGGGASLGNSLSTSISQSRQPSPSTTVAGAATATAAEATKASLALQERRLRTVDRFLPCPSPELVAYITGPWWEGSIHRVRHMAVEALLVYFVFNSLFGNGFIHSAPKAVEIMIYLNLPHLLGFLGLAITESSIRKSHSLLWLLRHPRQLPAITLVALPYLSLLVYCTCYFFPAPLPTATLLFAAVHQSFRAVDLARWYEVSPQGGGVQWVELRPAAPAPAVIAAAMHVLSGKRHRPLFVPSTPSSALLRGREGSAAATAASISQQRDLRTASFSRQASEERLLASYGGVGGLLAASRTGAWGGAGNSPLAPRDASAPMCGADSALRRAKGHVGFGSECSEATAQQQISSLQASANSAQSTAAQEDPQALAASGTFGASTALRRQSSIGWANGNLTFSSITDYPEQEPPQEIPVHDSYAIVLEDARQRGKSDLGIVGLDTAADIGLMRLYRRGQTLPSRLERRIVPRSPTTPPTNGTNANGIAAGASSMGPRKGSGTKAAPTPITTNSPPLAAKGEGGNFAESQQQQQQHPPRQSFYAFALPRSLLLLGAGSFSGTRFSNVRRVQKYVTWTLLSIFCLLLVALALQSVIPALQPTPMGLAIEEKVFTRASLDHLIIRLTFVGKGDASAAGGDGGSRVDTCTAGIGSDAKGSEAKVADGTEISPTFQQRQQSAANGRAHRTMHLSRPQLARESPFAPRGHVIGAWPADSEDEYPGLCRATFGNDVSVFELSVLSLLTYLPSARDVARALVFINRNMGTDWRLSTSMWANGTFADTDTECWEAADGEGGGASSGVDDTDDEDDATLAAVAAQCAEAERSRVLDWSGFFEFFDPKRAMRVIAVKGTDPTSVMDVLQDVNMFFEAALYQIITGVVPFAGILPTALATDFIRLTSMTDVLSRRELWDPSAASHVRRAATKAAGNAEGEKARKVSSPSVVAPVLGAADVADAFAEKGSANKVANASDEADTKPNADGLLGSLYAAVTGLLGGTVTANAAEAAAVVPSTAGAAAQAAEVADESKEAVAKRSHARRLARLRDLIAAKAARAPEMGSGSSELYRVTSDRDYHLRVMRYVHSRLMRMSREADDGDDLRSSSSASASVTNATAYPDISFSSDGAPIPLAVREQVIMTGHSMGGAIAHIAGTRLKLRSVAFGSPGIVLSHKKFGIKDLKAVHARAFTVASSNDIVPLIGWQGGEVHHLECAAKASAAELCHVMEFMIGALWHNCPSIRSRYPNLEDVI